MRYITVGQLIEILKKDFPMNAVVGTEANNHYDKGVSYITLMENHGEKTVYIGNMDRHREENNGTPLICKGFPFKD